ncbi:MAG: potassium channel protein [bacterium]|nr:MAG: potassium channel protein [bacterium]
MAASGIGSRLEQDLLGRRLRHTSPRVQLRLALMVLLLVVGLGTVGYMLVEGWGLLDAFYMTVLTLSTVGYGEVHPLSTAGKFLSIIVIVTGVGSAGFAVGTAGKLMLEDRIRAVLGRRSMKAIEKLQNHYIICGFGRMGRIICEELTERKIPFVILENSDAVLDDLQRHGYLFMKANATNDEELIQAGIERAAGLVSVVTDDAQNVFIVLTARGLNPKLNIVARSAAEETIKKLVRAGANRVISPYFLGGHRIAQAIVSPTGLDFLENIIQSKTMDLRLEEMSIAPKSSLVGTTLATSGLRKDFNIIILAIKSATGTMSFNPPFDTEIKAADTLIILGHRPDLDRLDQVAKGP